MASENRQLWEFALPYLHSPLQEFPQDSRIGAPPDPSATGVRHGPWPSCRRSSCRWPFINVAAGWEIWTPDQRFTNRVRSLLDTNQHL